MKRFLIEPSILSADFARLGDDVSKVISAGADVLHFDVMDNHYVPNLSMGPMILKALRNYGINIPINVHLMTKPIDRLILDFARSGATCISFHPESTEHIYYSLQLIKENGCKAGLVLNPTTTLDCLEYVIDQINVVVLMSVNPGFGGQLFLPIILNKISQTRKLIEKTNNRCVDLAVDGGINIKNISSIYEAGANVFIIGSAIFGGKNYRSIINAFNSILLG